jgi:hypothetical protein
LGKSFVKSFFGDGGYWILDGGYWMLDTGCLKIVIIDLNAVIYHPGITVVLQPEILITG